MPITNICGWETGAGGADNECSLFGGGSIVTTTKRSGDYALKALPVTTGLGGASDLICGFLGTGENDSNTTGKATAYFRFYINIAALPSAAEPIFQAASVNLSSLKFELRLNSGGTLNARDSALADLGTGSTVLGTSTWYRIEVQVATGASAAWEVKINGASELSGSTANLTTSNNRSAVLGKGNNRNGSGYEIYYDDFAVSDSAYPGAGAVACIRPNGNGNYTAWTGTSADVDDLTTQAGHDTDTTFISSSTNAQAETVLLENCSTRGISGTINAVKSITVVRDISNTTNIQMRTRVTSPGTADTDTTNVDPGATYRSLSQVFATNPSGGAAWDTAGVDSLEVGVEHNQAQARELRCTLICAMVDYTPLADALPPKPTVMLRAVPHSFNW